MVWRWCRFASHRGAGPVACHDGHAGRHECARRGADVHFDVTDEIGFVIDSGTRKAAVINSSVNPMLVNPSGYNDNTRDMVQPAWRVLEPQ